MKIPDDIKKQIANRDLTAREAAKLLDINENYLCKLLKDQGIKRIPGITTTHRKKIADLTKSRKDFRKLLVAQVKGRSKTIAQAAKEGKCSERTIYRMLDE